MSSEGEGSTQVLDQLSDTDLASTAPRGDVGSAGHLTHEDLEAYANGRLASARSSSCQAHLDSCEACRAELEDLRLLQSDLSGFQRSAPNQRERRKRRHGRTLARVASVAVIFAVVVSAMLWWKHESRRVHKESPAVSAAQVAGVPGGPASRDAPTAPLTRAAQAAPAIPRSTTAQSRDMRLADDLPALPGNAQPAASAAIQHSNLPVPADVSAAHDTNTGFTLLGPFGDSISETRPEFSWQSLPGAVRYSVVIVDTGLHPVQRSPSLRKTVWRPRRPLRRGRTYLWQVTATLRGGHKVVASRPSPSEALLRITPAKLAE